jgi:formylglycine-generating enzyme required for sulfatase activity
MQTSDAQPDQPGCAQGGPGVSDCGQNKESCCTSSVVSGGTYYRTYDVGPAAQGEGIDLLADGGDAGSIDPATISNLKLDKYDVTVGRFRQFVSAWNGGKGWLPTEGSGKHAHLNGGEGLVNSASPGTHETGWVSSNNGNVAPTDANLTSCSPYSTWTSRAGSQETLPINCVTWYEAYAFCIWDGGFLPSEAEWEYAAAGGNQQRQYPWGATDPSTASQYAIYNCYYPSGSGTCTGLSNIAPVGTASKGAGLWGQLDLVGNVWQWILDGYAPYAESCVDCAYLNAMTYSVIRGGGYDNLASALFPSLRASYSGERVYFIGFRCARTP